MGGRLTPRQSIFLEVEAERLYQDQKWGGPKHDDNEEDAASFVGYITEYARATSERARKHPYRTRMIKAAALAVAAVESYDRQRAAAKQGCDEDPAEGGAK